MQNEWSNAPEVVSWIQSRWVVLIPGPRECDGKFVVCCLARFKEWLERVVFEVTPNLAPNFQMRLRSMVRTPPRHSPHLESGATPICQGLRQLWLCCPANFSNPTRPGEFRRLKPTNHLDPRILSFSTLPTADTFALINSTPSTDKSPRCLFPSQTARRYMRYVDAIGIFPEIRFNCLGPQ